MSLVMSINLVEVFEKKGAEGVKEVLDTYVKKLPCIPGAQSYFVEYLRKKVESLEENPPTCREDVVELGKQINKQREHEESYMPFD